MPSLHHSTFDVRCSPLLFHSAFGIRTSALGRPWSLSPVPCLFAFRFPHSPFWMRPSRAEFRIAFFPFPTYLDSHPRRTEKRVQDPFFSCCCGRIGNCKSSAWGDGTMQTKISRRVADRISREVFLRVAKTLNEADRTGRLCAFAYSGNSLEKWLLCETYHRICRDWECIVPHRYASDWDTWMEVPCPGQEHPVKHIDLFLGPLMRFPGARGYEQPTPSTPVFEFKVLRDDDWPDGRKSVLRDCKKLSCAGLLNGFIVVLYRVRERRKLDELRKDLRDNVPSIEPLAEEHREHHVDLAEWSEGKVSFFAEAFRIVQRLPPYRPQTSQPLHQGFTMSGALPNRFEDDACKECKSL